MLLVFSSDCVVRWVFSLVMVLLGSIFCLCSVLSWLYVLCVCLVCVSVLVCSYRLCGGSGWIVVMLSVLIVFIGCFWLSRCLVSSSVWLVVFLLVRCCRYWLVVVLLLCVCVLCMVVVSVIVFIFLFLVVVLSSFFVCCQWLYLCVCRFLVRCVWFCLWWQWFYVWNGVVIRFYSSYSNSSVISVVSVIWGIVEWQLLLVQWQIILLNWCSELVLSYCVVIMLSVMVNRRIIRDWNGFIDYFLLCMVCSCCRVLFSLGRVGCSVWVCRCCSLLCCLCRVGEFGYSCGSYSVMWFSVCL